MDHTSAFATQALLIGVGATAISDLWSLAAKRLFGVAGPNWGLVGRWFGHFPRGRFVHDDIAQAAPIPGERAIGWGAHYAIGIAYAVLLLAIMGLDWAHRPTPLPALSVGIATVVAPFFLLQPGMGAGIAGAKTPAPNAARVRSLIAHTVLGLGLYLAALFWATLLRP